AARAAAADATVLFLYDAHLYPSNRALLDAVQARARHLAVVLLRDPYDPALLAPGVLGITAFGWARCQLDGVDARRHYPQGRHGRKIPEMIPSTIPKTTTHARETRR